MQQLQLERALEGISAASPFGEVAEAWLVELRAGATPDALRFLECRLREDVLPWFDLTPLNHMTVSTLELFLAREQIVSADRCRYSTAVLNFLMGFAVRNGVLSVSPMIEVAARARS